MCSCGLTLKRWFCIFLLISLALTISGIFFIIYGAMNYESVREEVQYKRAYRIGAVMDAGGSATRLTLFTMNEETKTMKIMFGKPYECENKGIASYTQDRLLELKQKMMSCLDKPFTDEAIPRYKRIPLYFGATGGMRLLKIQNETRYDETMALIKGALDRSQFKVIQMKVLDGADEAVNSWQSANFMKDERYRKGVIEFGSTSLQFVFESDQSIGKASSNIVSVDTKDGKRFLYRQSYLCFGGTETARRISAFLISKKSNGSHSVENPCYFNGYAENVTADDIFKSPCVSGSYAKDVLGKSFESPANKTMFTIQGTSNQTACANLFGMIYNSKCASGSSCGLNGVYQPSTLLGKFLGLSTLFYTARYMKLLSVPTNLTQYREKRDEICAQNWSQIEHDVYARHRCFDASYTYWVLTQGFKFPEKTNQIEFALKNKDGTNINWSLGMIQQARDDLYKNKGYPYRFTIITRSNNYLILIGIGVVFLIIGSVLLTCAVKAKRSDHDFVKTAGDEEMY